VLEDWPAVVEGVVVVEDVDGVLADDCDELVDDWSFDVV
jgi:hypothetical protein